MPSSPSPSPSPSPLDEETPHRYEFFFAVAFGISIFLICVCYSTWWRRCLCCNNNTNHNSDDSEDGDDEYEKYDERRNDNDKRIELGTTDVNVIDHHQHRRSTNQTTVGGPVRRVSWWSGCVSIDEFSVVAPHSSLSQSQQQTSRQSSLPFYNKYNTTTKEQNNPSPLAVSSGNSKSTGESQDIETTTEIIVETEKSNVKLTNEGYKRKASTRRGTGRFDVIRDMGIRFDEQPEEEESYNRKTISPADIDNHGNPDTLCLPV
mmetsp:Transcript_30517/g.74112  ORF Transcript_30517/g.74112 Transcript_30517/m.74112 type:complete len:262 (+) Transcript_30517:139-924(+)